MNSSLIYLMQSTLSLVIFYGFYVLLFKKEAYFVFNRLYLLAAIIISIFLPLITFSIPELVIENSNNVIITAPIYSIVEYTLSEVIIYGDAVNLSEKGWYNNLSFFDIFILIYIVGSAIAFFNTVLRLYQLSKFFKKSKVIIHQGLKVIFTTPGTPVFSFFNYIFINKSLLGNDKEIDKIIEHEKIHIRQNHSLDLLIAEIISIIQWYNPIVYLLKKSLKENHEFIADNNVVVEYPDISAYMKLLIEHSSIVKTNILTHNFSYSLLKRRLFMIKKTKSPLRFSLKLVVALMALNLVFFACSGPIQNEDIVASSQNNEQSVDPDYVVFTVVEEMPEFPGGMDELINYLSTSVNYPEAAKEKGIQGRVFLNFIVDSDGSIDSVKVLRGIGGGCDDEAVRVIAAMPNWKPGMQRGEAVRVSYNIPIKFTLDDKIADSIFTVVEVMPEFPGGRKELMTYLGSNIKYPEVAKKAKVHGRVFVSFVVETDGSVSGAKILRGIGSGCDEEALRVVNSMPKWSPGLKEGAPVRVQYNLPIKYALN